MTDIYNTYIYMDSRKPGKFYYNGLYLNFEPFYVGKGKIERVSFHIEQSRRTKGKSSSKKINKIRSILNDNMLPVIQIVKSNISEGDAHYLEKLVIKQIGRSDLNKGPLLNLTDGGEGTSGRKYSEETKRKISSRVYPKGEDHPNFGKKLSDSQKQKMSRKGYKHSEETLAKIAANSKLYWETRKSIT